MEQIRSFIAIELPEEVKDELVHLQEQLKTVDPLCAKWVNPAGIHLTLKFLGNVGMHRIDSICQAIGDASRGISPFHLSLDKMGAFPNLRRIQVVWVGLAGNLDQLKELQRKIEANLVPLGFPPEGRLFTPHLTLARLRETATPPVYQALGQIITNTGTESNVSFKVSCVSLMRSQLSRTGAIYTMLNSIELKPSC